ARMKQSTGVFGHRDCFSPVGTTAAGGRNAQWSRYSAPSAIQRRKSSFSSVVSALWISAGGIRSSSSVVKTLRTTSLFAGWPGTMGTAPDLAGFNASSRKSSRNRAFRALASNPWQRKHESVIIGRMSRLKSTFAASVIGPKLRKKQAAAAERRAPALRQDDKLGRAELTK